MKTKTVNIPAIHCGNCTNTIEMEVGEIEGVNSVVANADDKNVTIEWGEPATWDAIRSLLVEIEFEPVDVAA